MKINERLKLIGDLVEDKQTTLDIGCDHALLDIYLVKKNKNSKVIASDVKEGPLEQARLNIKREKLDNQIELRLGNGLDTYTNDINCVIISGMGGLNIIGILKNNLKIAKQIDTFILSPNNYLEEVKRFCCKIGFYIANEKLVKDKKFIYQVIVFKKGKKKYTNKEYFFGPILLQEKNDLFFSYYERELKSREIILKLLPKNYFTKRLKIKKEIKTIEEELH